MKVTEQSKQGISKKAHVLGYYEHCHSEHGIDKCRKHYASICPHCGYVCHVSVSHHVPVDVCVHYDHMEWPYMYYFEKE